MKIFEKVSEMLNESRMSGGGGIDKIGSTFSNYLDIGQRLVFQPITRCQIARLIIGQCRISTVFRHQMALVVYACEKLLHYYQV